MGKKKGLSSTGENVENLMEFFYDGNGFEESDVESDDGRRRSFRSSNKIIPEPDPEIQRFSDEIFGNFPKVEETEMEGENDEMGKSKSSSSSHRSSSSPKVEKIKKIGDISEKDDQKELRNFKLSPSIRPGVLSKVPSSGSFDKNIDDGSDES